MAYVSQGSVVVVGGVIRKVALSRVFESDGVQFSSLMVGMANHRAIGIGYGIGTTCPVVGVLTEVGFLTAVTVGIDFNFFFLHLTPIVVGKCVGGF